MIRFNSMDDLKYINNNTAAITIELIQSGNGFKVASKKWIREIKKM